MLKTISDWECDVQRGPNWLLVKVWSPMEDAAGAVPLAEWLWSLLQRHFTYRLVLEPDRIEPFDRRLIGQLVLLDDKIRTRRGVLRLCGLSAPHVETLRQCGVGGRFPVYRDREEAVLGSGRCPKPR